MSATEGMIPSVNGYSLVSETGWDFTPAEQTIQLHDISFCNFQVFPNCSRTESFDYFFMVPILWHR
jgi:hypothetical protein